MTIEDQITALLAQAEPLRCLADDEPAKVPLTAIVDEINRLRAIQEKAGPDAAFADELAQATQPVVIGLNPITGLNPDVVASAAEQEAAFQAERNGAKRGPGRPRKIVEAI